MFLTFISSKIVLSSVLSPAIAQIIKSFLHWKKTGKYDWRWLFRDAGMPSAHTATVTALTISVYLAEGLSVLFYVTLFMSSIVVRNVIGDKIFAIKQEKLINQIIVKIQKSLQGEPVQWKHLIGHTIREVIAGLILAVLVTYYIWFWI